MKALLHRYWLIVPFIFAALIAQTPASLLASILAGQSGDVFRLNAASGTIWHGKAQLALGDASLWQQLAWDWQAGDLLRGKLGFQLQADGGRARLQLGWSGIEFTEVDLLTPAGPFTRLDKRTASYGLSGMLRLTTPKIHFGKQAEGSLGVEWQRVASTQVPMPAELGSYRAQFTPQGDAWKINLSTVNGALQLIGTGTWRQKDGLAAEIVAKATPGSELALSPLLSQIGPGTPEQERRMKFNFR